MDESSLSIFRSVIEADYALIVMTYGSRRKLSSTGSELLDHPRVKCIEIAGIENWYHIGIACQLMDVRAIPAELEK